MSRPDELARPVPVLTGIALGGQAVICLPRPMVLAELTTFATLRFAGTFAEARQDAAACFLVDGWLEGFIERQQEDELEHVVLGHDTDPFDANDFFGPDAYFVWSPDPLIATMEWLTEHEPELASTFLSGDCSALFDSDPLPFVATEHRHALEHELRRKGRVLLECPDLAAQYMDPPFDPARELPDLANPS